MPPTTITRLADASRHLTVAGAIAALAGGLATMMAAPLAAQSIDLSAVAAGIGGFVLNGQAGGDTSGRSVSSAGDVNGDGLADVIVGANFSSPAAGSAAGRSYVVFGKTGTAGVDLIAVAGGTGGFVINGQVGADNSGRSVSSAGDVNGDGLADLIVGALYSDPAGLTSAGRSYVVFGKTDSAAVDLSAVSNGFGGFAINGQGVADFSGGSVSSAGDVNGDGLADVIVGAYGSDPAAGSNAGRSYVVFGKTSGTVVDLSTVAAGTSALGFVINGETTDARSGWSASSAGDVNGDGLADVIVGTRDYSGIGRSYVLFGKSTGAAIELSSVSSGTAFLGFVIRGVFAGDRTGFSVSGAGDVNGDRLADVIVGAPNRTLSGPFGPGASYVVFGRTLSTPVELSAVASGSSTLGFVLNGEATRDEAGASVSSAGDVNGDGLADVIVGARRISPPGGFYAGRSYVVFGKTGGAAVSLPAVATGTSGLGIVINGQSTLNYSGGSVSAAGDVNGDGFADVIVGASASATPAGLYSGRSYVVFGTGGPTVAATYRGHVQGYAPPNPVGIGTHRFGDDKTIHPDSRLWINFSGGGGPFGLNGASWVDVTLTRSKTTPYLGQFDNFAGVANVQWLVSSDRAGYEHSTITVRYTNAEVTGLVEGDLVMYHATSPGGPWTAAIGSTVSPARNEVIGIVPGLLPRYIAISTSGPDVTPPVAIITRLNPNPSQSQVAAWSIDFNEPVTGTLSAGQITPTGSLAGSIGASSFSGIPPYVVQIAVTGETVNGTLGFDLAAGGVVDLAGLSMGASSAPAYTIAEPSGSGGLAGDVDKNGVVNVADVTLLSNFIVNGAPPLP